MRSGNRLLLALDFTDSNYPSALYAMQQWGRYALPSEKYETILGPTTFAHRASPIGRTGGPDGREAMVMIARCCPGLTTVYWDRYVDQIALETLSRSRISAEPLYMDFSYGSAVNRWLLLANEMACDYLVRIDPGTLPPEGVCFEELIDEHIGVIKRSKRDIVVSRGYKGRLGIRDTFLLDGKAKDQYRLIKKMTGISPQRQVTGGAMFTSRVPGTPAIPFRKSEKGLTLVWGSDDALYQLLPSTRGSRKFGPRKIPRFGIVGKDKTTIEYYRGVAGMIALASLMRGETTAAAAAKQVEHFLSELMKLLDEEKCKKNDANKQWPKSFTRENIAPDEFIEQIVSGYDNYTSLLAEWPGVCEALRGKLYPYIQIT